MPLTLLRQAYFQRDRRRHRRDAATAVTVGQTNIRRYSRLQSGGRGEGLIQREIGYVVGKKRRKGNDDCRETGQRSKNDLPPSTFLPIIYLCIRARARCVCVCVSTKLLRVISTYIHTRIHCMYARTQHARTFFYSCIQIAYISRDITRYCAHKRTRARSHTHTHSLTHSLTLLTTD